MFEALWELLASRVDLTVFEFVGVVVGVFVLGFFSCAAALAFVFPKEVR